MTARKESRGNTRWWLRLFEHRTEPLLPQAMFHRRVAIYAAIALTFIFVALLIGVLGYRLSEDMSWIDALLNASMILGGMGQVTPLQTVAGKLFASCYALFAGMIFLVAAGILFAPIFHRFLHHFHADLDDVETPEKPG